MKSRARVVVIGGGVAGCSIAYHLTRLGWSDVVVLERREIASGASAYAAGDLPHFAESPLASRLVLESTRLYPRLEAETGHAVGWHRSGSLRLALSRAHMEDYRRHAAKARLLGMPFELIGPEQIRALCPILNMDGVVGAAWTPDDGHIDPSSVTNAFASGARDGGATIHCRTAVTGLTPLPDGEWRIATDRGELRAGLVVNAAGWWAREVSRMAGHDLAMTLHEHQYLVTEPIPDLEALDGKIPMLRDMGAPFYARQEAKGLLCSAYEAEPRFVGVGGIPPGFGEGPLPPDLERSARVLERCIHRLPCLGRVGIRRVTNAPVMRSPDGEPMLGPVPGLRNFWVAAAFGGGFITGSFGRYFAEWLVEGEPSIDLWPLDIRRFGSHVTQALTYAMVRARHSYSADVVYPHSEPQAGRPLKAGPLYERLRARGAVFGVRNGWEAPNWFAPEGAEARDRPAFRRANWFDAVGAECRLVRDRVGISDLTSLAKFEVSGAGAPAFLDRLCASQLPAPGSVAATVMLTPRGGVAALADTARLAEERFYLFTWGAAETFLEDWLRRHAPEGDVVVENVSARWGTLLLAGPASRAVLAALAAGEVSNDAFPPGQARETTVGLIPVRLLRVGDPGELAYQLHHRIEYQLALYEALMAAGAVHGIGDFGLRALRSLRLEKARPEWGVDLTAGTHVLDAGCSHLVALAKDDFIGRKAVESPRSPGQRVTCLAVETADADAAGLELVARDGRPAGLVSSGAYGYRTEVSLAFARLAPDCAVPGTRLSVEILGEPRAAVVIPGALYDPSDSRVMA
jgi:dimethylglycine dehydrogenase